MEKKNLPSTHSSEKKELVWLKKKDIYIHGRQTWVKMSKNGGIPKKPKDENEQEKRKKEWRV